MKTIPRKVLLAWALCIACFVFGGAFTLCAQELAPVSQAMSVLGILAVGCEAFRWGADEGYGIADQPSFMQIQHAIRCIAMGIILVIAAAFIAGSVLQIVFEAFWRG